MPAASCTVLQSEPLPDTEPGPRWPPSSPAIEKF